MKINIGLTIYLCMYMNETLVPADIYGTNGGKKKNEI